MEGDEPGVQRGHENGVSCYGHAPIHRPTTDQAVVRQLMVVPPKRLAGSGIERKKAVVRAADVHDAVVHNGRDFELSVGTRRKGPGDLQVGYGRGCEFLDRAVPVIPVISSVEEPLSRIFQAALEHRGVHSLHPKTDGLVIGPVCPTARCEALARLATRHPRLGGGGARVAAV